MKGNLLLIGIILFGLFIRGYQLDSYPSLNPDEAALGYNAYSLITTGLDEHGISWPLHFRSFGDYKPGGYVYLAIPFVKLLGLTPLAVRLPNLILSTFSLYLVFLLVRLITKNLSLATISAIILCLSPWHIHFSRGAWESSTSIFFIVLGIYWFYQYIFTHRLKFLYFFPFPLVFSFYIYHSARLVVPALFLALLLVYRQHFFLQIQHSLSSLLLALVVTIPILVSFFTSGGTTRFGGIGITADTGPQSRAEELLNHHHNTLLINRVTHNRRLLYFFSWTQKYLAHFGFNFLFLRGDDVPRSKSPDMGQAYLFELPLFLFGLVILFRTSSFHFRRLVTLLFVTSPLASSLTFQSPSALRSLLLCLPLTIVTSISLNYFLNWHRLRLIIFICYFFSVAYFLDAYFVHGQKRYPFAWNTAFPQAINQLLTLAPNYQNVYFTNAYDQPYILYLFYSQYFPTKLHSQIKLTPPDRYGFSTVSQIDNIHFGPIKWENIPLNSLIIASTEPTTTTPSITINFPNGSPGFKIYQR